MIHRKGRGLYVGDVCARFDGDRWGLMSDIRGCIRDFRCENYGYPPSCLLVDGEGYDLLSSVLDEMFENLPVWVVDSSDGFDGLVVESLPVRVVGS